MATFAAHGTATSTASTVTLDGYFSRVTVVNRGTSALFFTTDGVTAPTVAGADTYVCLPSQSITVGNKGPIFEPIWYDAQMTDTNQAKTPAKTVVKVIASASSDYSVMGY